MPVCLERLIRPELVVGQHRAPRDQLVRRTWRVDLTDGVVEEWLVRVTNQGLVVRVRDPVHKQVVVIRGQADHREHLAGLRVHHDDHARLEPRHLDAPLQRGLRLLLGLQVDRQLQGVARLRLGGRAQHLDLATGCVAFDLLRPVGAPQLLLVLGLDARLPDDVVRQISLRLQLPELVRADRTCVAQELGEGRAEQVVAARLGDHLYPRQREVLLRDKPRHVFGHVALDPHEIEARARVAVDRLIDCHGGHPEHPAEVSHDLVALAIRQVRRPDLHRERRHIDHERPPRPVHDEPTARWDRLRDRHVRRGLPLVVAAAPDLEVEEPHGQSRNDDEDSEPEQQETR